MQDEKLRGELLKAMRELTAKMTEDCLNVRVCRSLQECDALVKDKPLLDLVCCDISTYGLLDWTVRFREEYTQARLMLIADQALSPLAYLRPQILASPPQSPQAFLESLGMPAYCLSVPHKESHG